MMDRPVQIFDPSIDEFRPVTAKDVAMLTAFVKHTARLNEKVAREASRLAKEDVKDT